MAPPHVRHRSHLPRAPIALVALQSAVAISVIARARPAVRPTRIPPAAALAYARGLGHATPIICVTAVL